MITWLQQFDPVMQALFATLFTWALTALGAGMVFFLRQYEKKS